MLIEQDDLVRGLYVLEQDRPLLVLYLVLGERRGVLKLWDFADAERDVVNQSGRICLQTFPHPINIGFPDSKQADLHGCKNKNMS